ncbi:MAG: hypothetical protein KDB27_20075 [Planctomycetales bacterium]|nr:hypothetical protein [Planctomycetales bacterium]
MKMNLLLRSIAISLAILAPLTGQDVAGNRAGPKIGSIVPDFTLNDQEGNKRSLSTLLEQGAVAIVFHRSADW